jgi:undecaprenyl pyrophosphate synthase
MCTLKRFFLKNSRLSPKKRGVLEGFLRNSLTNKEQKTYHVGPMLLSLWKNCDGKRDVEDITRLMIEEHVEEGYTPATIHEMLDLLETRKLIDYPTA